MAQAVKDASAAERRLNLTSARRLLTQRTRSARWRVYQPRARNVNAAVPIRRGIKRDRGGGESSKKMADAEHDCAAARAARGHTWSFVRGSLLKLSRRHARWL